MKNVIFQYFLNYNGVGKQAHHYPTEGIPEWALRSSNYFKAYAEKHNADYYFFTDRFVNATSNFFEVLRLYKDTLFDQYDKLLYVDVDVIPKNMNESIFDIEIKDVAGWSEYRDIDIAVPINWSATGALQQRFADFGSRLINSKNNFGSLRMINSGVMVWSKKARLHAREHFIDHELWFNHKNALLDPKWTSAGHSSHCLDQPFINAMWNKFQYEVVELDMKWNRFPTHNENKFCNFAHYVGDYRLKIPEMFPEI